jgi:hypothetical protein
VNDRQSSRDDEGAKERIDRELMELLQELRVAIPGIQVLFAFLLTIPFSQGFSKLSSLDRRVYAASLLFSAASTGLLIAPTAFHRLHFRAGNKERMLFTSNRLAIVGLALLAAAVSCAVFVVMVAVFSLGAAVAMAAGVGIWFVWFWYALPLVRRYGQD